MKARPVALILVGFILLIAVTIPHALAKTKLSEALVVSLNQTPQLMEVCHER